MWLSRRESSSSRAAGQACGYAIWGGRSPFCCLRRAFGNGGGFSNNKPPQDFLFSWVVKKSQLSGLGEENRPGRQMSSDLEFSLSLPVKQLVRSYTGAATPQSPPLTPKTDTAESPPLVLHAHSAVRACRGDPDVPPLLRRYSSSGCSLRHGSRTKPCTGSSIDDIAPGQ